MEGRQGQAQAAGTLTRGASGRGAAGIGAWLLFFCIAFPAGAEIYRWRDEQGRLQYGDRPPAGVTAELVEPDTVPSPYDSSPDRRMQQERVLDALGDDRKEREEAKAAARAAREERRQRCDAARRELEAVQTASYLYDSSKDPENPRIYSDAERAAYTRKAEEDVKHWCGS